MGPPAKTERLLWLLRHAKTVADPPPGGSDHDRPLAPRGRRDADALARRLAGGRLGFETADFPGLVLCSTAVRTRQTIERALALMAEPPPVDLRRALYQAYPEQVLEEVRTIDDGLRSVMVVGHNPTAQALANSLAEPDEDPDAEGLKAVQVTPNLAFPTCSLAVYRLPIRRWSDAAEGIGTLLGRFSPPY